MTNNEIIQALRCISRPAGTRSCYCCKYYSDRLGCDADRIWNDAADLIERLTAENEAQLEYAKLFTGCDTCRHGNYCKTDSECNACEQDVKGNCYCKDCERGSNWAWRGLPGVPEKGDGHGTTD